MIKPISASGYDRKTRDTRATTPTTDEAMIAFQGGVWYNRERVPSTLKAERAQLPMMKSAHQRLVALGLTVFVIGCGNSTPTAPTPPPPVVEACVTNRTGTVTLRNAGSRTVDMFWNNTVRGTVTPGQTTPEFTVPASGPQYIFDAIITNTNIRPCQQLVATPIQCQVNAYATCSGF